MLLLCERLEHLVNLQTLTNNDPCYGWCTDNIPDYRNAVSITVTRSMSHDVHWPVVRRPFRILQHAQKINFERSWDFLKGPNSSAHKEWRESRTLCSECSECSELSADCRFNKHSSDLSKKSSLILGTCSCFEVKFKTIHKQRRQKHIYHAIFGFQRVVRHAGLEP